MKSFHCQNCGAELTEENASSKFFRGKSEMGFDVLENIFVCPNCGAEHIICPECQGWSYGTKEDDYYDCELCSGMGMILTSEIYK